MKMPAIRRTPLLSLFLLLLESNPSFGVFRFCYEGTWHQITSKDCPYGVHFNKRIFTPCFYSQGKDTTVPRIWPSFCDEPFVNVPENQTENAIVTDKFVLAQRSGEFQFIQYGVEGNLTGIPIWDDVLTLQECTMRCSMKIVPVPDDHESSDSVEEPAMPVRPALNESIVKQLTDQTLRMGDYLYDQLMDQDANPGPDLRIVRLFKKTMEVMERTCEHPFITNDFNTRVLYGFLFLVGDNGVGEIEDVTVEEFELIMEALNVCALDSPTFRLEGKGCSIVSTVESIVRTDDDGNQLIAEFNPAKWPKEKRRFPYESYDIVIESAWQAVQVIHGACFATFKPNANMHHRYIGAMEQLFGEKILQRWRYPTKLIDPHMWGTWFLADVDSTYMNTIACVRAAYYGAPFGMKLDRPIDAKRSSPKLLSRKKRSGGFSSLKDYWTNYENTGGITAKLPDQLQCFQTEKEKERVMNDYIFATCPSGSDLQRPESSNSEEVAGRTENTVKVVLKGRTGKVKPKAKMSDDGDDDMKISPGWHKVPEESFLSIEDGDGGADPPKSKRSPPGSQPQQILNELQNEEGADALSKIPPETYLRLTDDNNVAGKDY